MSLLTTHPNLLDTKDLDEVRSYISRTLHRRIHLLKSRSFRMRMRTIPLELLMAGAVDTTGDGELAGSFTASAYTLGGIQNGGLESRMGNAAPRIYGPGEGNLSAPGNEYSTALRPADSKTSTLVVSVPAKILHHEIEKLIERSARKPLIVTGPLDLRATTLLGQILQTLYTELDRENSSLLQFPDLSREIQRMLITELIASTPNNYTELLRQGYGAKASEHVARFIRCAATHIEDGARVTDIAREIGINERTLRDVCQRARGQTPAAILRALRFFHANQRIQREPNHLIFNIAHEYGHMNIGRFTHGYEELLGETPAETRRRARRKRQPPPPDPPEEE